MGNRKPALHPIRQRSDKTKQLPRLAFSSMVRAAAVLLIAAGLGSPRSAQAVDCSESRPLLELITGSDAIAVIKVSALRGGLHQRGFAAVTGFEFQFDELIKRPVLDKFDLTKPQLLRHEARVLRYDEVRKYLAFLRLAAENVWTPVPCGLFPLTERNEVADACKDIADLFAADRFSHERNCLLAYPPDVGLQVLKKEITKHLLDGREAAGSGNIVSAGIWRSDWNYQRISFRLDTRQRKALFRGLHVKRPFPIAAYIKTSALTEQEYNKLTRKGRRFTFKGIWFKGSLVLDPLE